MEIKSIEMSEGKFLVVPVGDVDMGTSVELREALQKLTKNKVPNIIVNLQGVSYLDSSGLATLIECMQKMEKYKGNLKLVINNPKVMDVFKLARLHRIFSIHDTVEAANQ